MQSVVGFVLLAFAGPALVNAAGGTTEETCMSISSQDDTDIKHMGLLQTKREKARALLPLTKAREGTVPASGANASLDENGYRILAGQCCMLEMIQYIRRVVEQQGFQVCAEGGLYGMAPWYTCQKGPSTFAQMITDIATNRVSDCPFVGDVNAECPEVAEDCEEFPNIEPEDCGCSRGNSWNIDFNGAVVTQSNLMGYGPDTGVEEIRYQNIGVYNGQTLDLVVTGLGDYAPANNRSNGKNGGVFGNINIRGGYNIELDFMIAKTGTVTPVEVNELHFTLFDLDHTQFEKMLEIIRVSGFYSYSVDLESEFSVEYNDTDSRTVFRSTHPGSGCDNPKSPETLGIVTCQAHGKTMVVDQRKRSFMMIYRDVSSWHVGVEVTCNGPKTDTECASGRNILFAGTSTLKDRCTD